MRLNVKGMGLEGVVCWWHGADQVRQYTGHGSRSPRGWMGLDVDGMAQPWSISLVALALRLGSAFALLLRELTQAQLSVWWRTL